jgi:hypothetical protein
MRGARGAATETYQVDRRGSEHRATKQMMPAAVFQQPVNAQAAKTALSSGQTLDFSCARQPSSPRR